MRRPAATTAVFFSAALLLAALFLPVRESLARRFAEMALTSRAEGRLQTALRQLDWSLFFNDSSLTRLESSLCHQLRGDFRSSRRALMPLLSRTEELDLPSRAVFYHTLGVNLFRLDRPLEAIEAFRRSVEVATRGGERALAGRAMVDWGRVLYHARGQSGEAKRLLERALGLGQALEDRGLQADALRHLGVIRWWFEGDLESVESRFFQPALELYRAVHDQRGEAAMLANIGLLRDTSGDASTSLKYQQESLEIRERIDDGAGQAESYRILGDYYRRRGNIRQARRHFQRSLDLSDRADDRLNEAEVLDQLAEIQFRMGEWDEAISLWTRLLEREADNPVMAKYRLSSLSRCYRAKGEDDRAIELIRQALAMESVGEDVRFFASMWIYLAEIHLDRGALAEAEEALRQAEEILRREQLPGGLRQDLAQARLALLRGDSAESLRRLSIAADRDSEVFQRSAPRIASALDSQSFEPLFEFLLSHKSTGPHLWRVDDQPRRVALAFRFLELLRYRSFRSDVMQLGGEPNLRAAGSDADATAILAELARQNARGADDRQARRLREAYSRLEDTVLKARLNDALYRIVREAAPSRLPGLRKGLRAGTALLEYLFVEGEVFALVVTPDAAECVRLPVSPDDLSAKVKLMRSLLLRPSRPSTGGSSEVSPRGTAASFAHEPWFTVAADLERALLRPLAEAGLLRGIRRLGIVPWGRLHDLPFAALVREGSEGTAFLVEEYALFYIPSATFYLSIRQRDGRSTQSSPGKGSLLSFGKGTPSGDMEALRFATHEARQVAEAGGGEVWVDEDASETRFKQLAPHFDILHVATHALMEPEMPLLSRILLTPTAQDDGNLTVSEILRLGLRSDLVVLSACQTARSFAEGSDEAITLNRVGLIDAFLHAGADSVLATLLPIADRSSVEFFEEFYRNLPSMDKAEALAQAQRAFLRGTETMGDSPASFAHPRHWASFVLVGDDR